MLRRSTLLSRITLATLTALALFALAAPAAFAVSTAVRVEGSPSEVAPETTVSVPDSGTVVDTDGTSFSYRTGANALAALDRAAALRGFIYSFNTLYGAPFLEMVAGLSADPSDWSNGWTYMVNGVGYPILDMGAADCILRTGDRVVFTQNPDATFSRGAKLLRLRLAPRPGVEPGDTIRITVVGDDVAKANSTAEAERWGLDPIADPSLVEPPANFAPVPGATLHVGSRAYVDGAAGDAADGTVAISDLPKGTYGVWAEMTMDASFSYVRSTVTRIDVNDGARISGLRVSPSPYRAGRRMAIRFRLDKRATVSARIVNNKGRVVAKLGARTLNAGSRILYWGGRAQTALTSHLTVKVQSVDSWSRSVTATTSVRVVR
ncbi:MAG TPA: DUF4430 domain-containing protein [Thermoleophilia bacterium]|nr:DUF4430 domain-containing protein [Thermoleophilia bacterium]HQJ97330.1 DUF4430 domain-containing protein [Thermoleophilia bacterium]